MEYTVSRVETEQDTEAFIGILNRYRRNDGRDKVEWFYKDGEMFLLKTKTGEVVGTKGYGFREFQYNGKMLTGAISADIVVDEKHRTLKPALVLNRESMNMLRRRVDFHYTVPNKNSDALFKRRGSGFKKAGQFKRYVKILDTKIAFGSKIENTFISNALGSIVNLPWRVFLNIKRDSNVSYLYDTIYPGGYGIDHLSPYFMGVNTTTYLNWRFDQNPQRHYKIVTLGKGKNSGFVIYYEKENRAHVSCILYPTTELYNLYWILSGFEKYCVKNKNSAIVITCIADENHEDVFKQLWYRQYIPAGNLWVSENLDVDVTKYLVYTGDIDAE